MPAPRLGSFGSLPVEMATGRHNPFYTECDRCIAQGTPWGAQRGAQLSKKVECTFFAPVWLCGAFRSFPNLWILESVCWWQNPAWMDMIAAPR